jgi:hypothetical protein
MLATLPGVRVVAVLRDTALAALAVAVVGGAGWTVLREPTPAAQDRLVAPVPVRTSAAPEATPTPVTQPTPAPLPPAPAVTAAVLKAPSTRDAHLAEAAKALGWALVPADLAQPVPPQQVVLVQTAFAELNRTLQLVRGARTTAPDSRIVVLAPVDNALSDEDVDVVEAAAVQARAEFLDPVALGWTTPEGTFGPDGAFTPDGAARVGALLAERLRG